MMPSQMCEVARPYHDATPRTVSAKSFPSQARRVPVRLSAAEEWAAVVTHGVGLLLSLAGAVTLVAHLAMRGQFWQMAGCLIFCATLIAVYAASTLSHMVIQPRPRFFLRTLDQAVIYLLIVGTYTPFALTYLRGGWWPAFLTLMWSGAILGFVSKLFFAHRVESVAIWSYVGLGWMLGIAVIPLWSVLGPATIGCLFAGGVAYTVGTFFLMNDRKVRHFHALWHLLVLCGSGCHYAAICFSLAA